MGVRSPLWPLLRPRKFQVFGVGAPKTGTLSLYRLFQPFRSAHEAHGPETIQLLKQWTENEITEQELRTSLRRRDRAWRLECDVAHFLALFTPSLQDLFPKAKFICTVRAPRSWLRSIIDQCINNERDQLPDAWRSLRDLNFGSPPETYPLAEQALAQYGLHSIDGFLS